MLNAEDTEILNDYKALIEQQNEIKSKIDELKPYVVEIMEDYKITKMNHNGMIVSYIPETEQKSFDTVKFKKEHPDVSEQYMKVTTRKAYIKTIL